MGLAALLAGVVGLGFIWIVAGRRRRRPLAPAPVAARVAAAPPADEWTNVRLDDNDALPTWLRAIPHAEHALSTSNEVPFAMEEPIPSALTFAEPPQPDPRLEDPARPALAFAEPLQPGAMRLAVAGLTELLDHPSDVGVVLTMLVAGDEVEIQDIEEPWVRVMTPLGSTGWLRTTSLGVGSKPPDEPAPADPEQPKPKRRGARPPRRTRSARSAT